MSESARVAKDLLRKSFPSGIDKTHAISRRSGKERFERIKEKLRRENSQSQQIKQMKTDLMRLNLTTGAHGALLIISPSFGVHKIATAGDFNSFLQIYASALTAQRKMTRRDVRYNSFRLPPFTQNFKRPSLPRQMRATKINSSLNKPRETTISS